MNLPTFRFRVTDNFGTPTLDSSTLRYRHLVAGVELRGPTTFERQKVDEPYVLPISYQSLSPSIGTTEFWRTHTIEVTASDRAKNKAVRTFKFSLELLSPPAFLHHCHVDPGLAQKSLETLDLHEVYNSGNLVVDMVRASIVQRLDLPTGSLAPMSAIRFPLDGGTLRSNITEVPSEKIWSNYSHWKEADCAVPGWKVTHHGGANPNVPFGCQSGLFPEISVFWNEYMPGQIDDGLPHVRLAIRAKTNQPSARHFR